MATYPAGRACRQAGVRAAAAILVAAAAARPSIAQIPTIEQVRSTPLPGPAPAAVVTLPSPHPPTAHDATGGPGTPAFSPWEALREAEAELRRRTEDIDRCRARLRDAQVDLETTQRYLGEIEAARSLLRAEVQRRLVLLDRIGRGGLARLILTSRDPGEARFRARLFRRLVRADAATAARYAAVAGEAEAVRLDLANKIAAQRELERRLDERRRLLEAEIERHRALVTSMSGSDAAAGLRAEARAEVDAILAQALGSAPAAQADSGSLRRLASAAVGVPASFPVDDDGLRGGVSVRVPAGTPVASPVSGVVAFVGMLAGYGPSVLIRTAHGDGALLVGHLDALSVGPGDTLQPGAVIGRAAPSFSDILPPLIVDAFGNAARAL